MIKLKFKQHYKVLHITNEMGKYSCGGIGSFINELYRYHGEEVGFVHIYDIDRTNGLAIKSYPGSKDILALSSGDLCYLNELSFDIAVSHFYGFSFLVDETILRGRPLVFVVHLVRLFFARNTFTNADEIEMFKKMCARANKIVCVSYAELDKLKQYYPEYGSKAEVIYNGLELEPEELDNKSVGYSRKIFGYMGRTEPNKNLLDCVRAFKGINAQLRVACDTFDKEYFAMVKDYIEGARLEEKVEFFGWCYGSRKKCFLNSLDALIVPTLYEAFGYVVLEAMRNRIPIICSNQGGIPEIVGTYKYCYNPYELNGLKNCIRSFREDTLEEVQWEVTALFSRTILFAAKNMVQKYTELFDDLLNKQFYDSLNIISEAINC